MFSGILLGLCFQMCEQWHMRCSNMTANYRDYVLKYKILMHFASVQL